MWFVTECCCKDMSWMWMKNRPDSEITKFSKIIKYKKNVQRERNVGFQHERFKQTNTFLCILNHHWWRPTENRKIKHPKIKSSDPITSDPNSTSVKLEGRLKLEDDGDGFYQWRRWQKEVTGSDGMSIWVFSLIIFCF